MKAILHVHLFFLLFTANAIASAQQTDGLEEVSSVLVYNEGRLYKAKDPLPGATGSGGSVWSVLGDMLVDSGLFTKVIIVPVAIGNTAIDCRARGECYQKLLKTLRGLDSAHIKLTHIFWRQGEIERLCSKGCGNVAPLFTNSLFAACISLIH